MGTKFQKQWANSALGRVVKDAKGILEKWYADTAQSHQESTIKEYKWSDETSEFLLLMAFVEDLQKQHPELILGGSLALRLLGVKMERPYHDIDMIVPVKDWDTFELADTAWKETTDNEYPGQLSIRSFSMNETSVLNLIKATPLQRAATVIDGILVTDIEDIIQAKINYVFCAWDSYFSKEIIKLEFDVSSSKHFQDLLNIKKQLPHLAIQPTGVEPYYSHALDRFFISALSRSVKTPFLADPIKLNDVIAFYENAKRQRQSRTCVNKHTRK